MRQKAAGGDEMTCDQLVALVTEYLDGALAAADSRPFHEHLLNCPDCVVHLQQLQGTISILGELPRESISPQAAQALLRTFRDWRTT